MSDLWMETDDAKEKLSDIDPENLDEACQIIYNLHEDALRLRSEVAELQAINKGLLNALELTISKYTETFTNAKQVMGDKG